VVAVIDAFDYRHALAVLLVVAIGLVAVFPTESDPTETEPNLDPGASVSWDVYRGSEVSCVLSVETRIRSADGVMIESPSREVSHWYHANRTSERVILRGLNWTAYAVDLDAGTVTRLSTARVDDDCRWTVEGVSA
jgi:hypothetical protein